MILITMFYVFNLRRYANRAMFPAINIVERIICAEAMTGGDEISFRC